MRLVMNLTVTLLVVLVLTLVWLGWAAGAQAARAALPRRGEGGMRAVRPGGLGTTAT